jgi:methylmalonyl-CoA mutase N-terminal domain/subunit
VSDDLSQRVAAWRERRTASAHSAEADGHTVSGLPVQELYTPADVGLGGSTEATEAYLTGLGLPGEPPYTRGIRPGMYRDELWVMGLYSGLATPKETNQRIRRLLEHGQRGFSIALDLPTQNGYDADHPIAMGEVGRVGVPVSSLRDMEDLLEGIPLDEVTQIRTTANAIGPIAVALFIAAAESHGYSPADFRVMLQNDVLKEYIARGTYVVPPRRGLELAIDAVEYCARELPHWEPIEFCGYHVRDAGATAVQELAIALADGMAYIDAALARGLTVDQVASKAVMFLSSSIEIFEEAAKFRSARRLWHALMTEQYGAKDPTTAALTLFSYTLGGSLTAQEPLNNIARIAFEALSAVLGGTQTLATSSFDEALGVPSDEASQVALRIQQILAYETGVTRTADPLGGSYYLEALTDRVEAEVWAYLQRIDDQGGALAAVESGWLQAELADEAYRQQMDLEGGSRQVVGVNTSGAATPEKTRFSTPTASADTEREQRERLAALKQERDGRAVEKSLEALRGAASRGENTVPPILDAVRAYATVGEICGVLTDLWGRYHPTSPV